MPPKSSRAQANRANSQHSTGPKTSAGKKSSSRNALSHGLTAQTAVMPHENLKAYQNHLESFAEEYHPKGPTEAHLVQALADTSWRLNRIAALEANALTAATDFESQTKALANLSLHSQRLSRQFERTVTHLRDLQKTRLTEERKEMSNLLDIMNMFEVKGEPYDPSEDGFVFSQDEINSAILARNRAILAAQVEEFLR